jgi:hypothetical protein
VRSGLGAKCAGKLAVVYHEWTLALIELFRHRAQGWIDQPHGSNHPARGDLYRDLVPNLFRNELDKLTGGEGWSAWYVPYLARRFVPLAQDRECSREINDERTGVELIGVAEQLGWLPPQNRVKHAVANRGKADPGPIEVR